MNLVKLNKYELPFMKPKELMAIDPRHSDFESFIYCKNENRMGGGGFHPGRAAAIGIIQIANEDYILAESMIEYLLAESYIENETRYFPYGFDFKIHDNEKEVIPKGWVSGFAQGLILLLFCRFGRITDSIDYDEYIDDILNSLKHSPILKKRGTGIWFEEYPGYCTALNGHIYALYGLYEYYYTFDEGRDLLLAGIEAVKEFAEEYRNPGAASYYCTEHKIICDKVDYKYHKLHINQFKWLYSITRDEYFKKFYENLLQDVNAWENT